MRYLISLSFLSLLLLSGCNKADASDTAPSEKGITVRCKAILSEVKWFWGEICPIGKEGYLSIGNSQSQGHVTTGCVTLSQSCEVSQN